MLDVAISIASQAFEGIRDKGDKPYILHCLYVMNEVAHLGDEELMAIAILHDLVEDTEWTIDGLRKKGFSERVIHGINYLTHDRIVSYEDYIENIKRNDDAIIIKRADLRHNSDITRIKGVTNKDLLRIVKYHNAYISLNGL